MEGPGLPTQESGVLKMSHVHASSHREKHFLSFAPSTKNLKSTVGLRHLSGRLEGLHVSSSQGGAEMPTRQPSPPASRGGDAAPWWPTARSGCLAPQRGVGLGNWQVSDIRSRWVWDMRIPAPIGIDGGQLASQGSSSICRPA